MKKYLSFALAAALSAAFCATAFAAEDNRQVEVKTHIDPTYTVTIPANTTVICRSVRQRLQIDFEAQLVAKLLCIFPEIPRELFAAQHFLSYYQQHLF